MAAISSARLRGCGAGGADFLPFLAAGFEAALAVGFAAACFGAGFAAGLLPPDFDFVAIVLLVFGSQQSVVKTLFIF
jgi:hypothetical protein